LNLVIPTFVFITIVCGVIFRVPCLDSFKNGATEGLETILKLVPTLIGLICAVGVFRASGLMDIISGMMVPVFERFGVESDISAMVLMRPVSGSAALAILKDIIKGCGENSKTVAAAAIMMGSTETILYTLTVYTSETKLKKVPNVIPAVIVSTIVSTIGAIIAAGLI